MGWSAVTIRDNDVTGHCHCRLIPNRAFPSDHHFLHARGARCCYVFRFALTQCCMAEFSVPCLELPFPTLDRAVFSPVSLIKSLTLPELATAVTGLAHAGFTAVTRCATPTSATFSLRMPHVITSVSRFKHLPVSV